MSYFASIPTISQELRSAFQGYISSPIFELVAKDDVTFYVHKDILAHHSQPFKDATSGTWKESHERKILLPDWDAKTVGHLVQFLYTGDYNYPDTSACDEPGTPVEPEELVPAAPKPNRTGALTPLPECIKDALHDPHTPPTTEGAWLERVDTAKFDFEETFLTHATVYTLAQYKSIAALKSLAYGRLSRTLLKIHRLGRNPHLATNIISLATYVYANTDSLTSSEEPLRRIVSQYVALNFETWQAEPAAVQLMCSGGDFAKDVLGKICRRLGRAVVGLGLAPPGTRYVVRFRAVTQNFSPSEYIRELDSLTGNEKSDIQSIWLIPEYTTEYTKAATHFYLSQTSGLAITTIMARSCGSTCKINRASAADVNTRIVDIVLVRTRDNFLDLGLFAGFDGMVSHTAHQEGYESLHVLWRSMRVVPA